LLKEEFTFDERAVEKVLKVPGVTGLLMELKERLDALADFSAHRIEELCRNFAVEKNLNTGAVFHPLRVATSGRTQGPSLFHYLEVLGKERVVKRIEKTCSALAVR
jgi:glutamyl-tRNA synthetase